MKPYNLFLFLFAFPLILFAQQKEKNWTPEDIIYTEYVRSAQFSPDNEMVVWSKRKPLKEKDKFVSDLYLTRTNLEKDGKFRTFQLTSSEDNDYNPLFSADNEQLYFLSSREKGKKLWSLSLYGGEAKAVHTFEKGVSNLRWLNDSTLIYISSEGKTLTEQQLEKEKDNTKVIEDTTFWTPRRVYTFDIKKQKTLRITNNTKPVSTFRTSPDGRWLVYQLTMSPHYASDAQPDPKYFLQDLENGKEIEILEGLQTPSNFQFTANNDGFYFTAEQSSDPEWNGAGVELVYFYDLSTKSYSKIPLNWKWASNGRYWVVGQDILTALPNGATNILAYYRKNGSSWNKTIIDLGDKTEHVNVSAVSKDGSRIIYVHSTTTDLPQYYVADITATTKGITFSNEKVLVEVNKKLKKKVITRSEVIKWEGYNGEEVNGLLYYPRDYEAGKKYPLVISIHGGPAGIDMDSWSERWSTYPQLLAQRGAFVLKPNYHGSSNHGQAFVESIKGNYYDLELEDITKGIDYLEKQGLIDRTQMGVMGWSNGAILTTMLTVRYPDMFKVACAGAGDVNWTSDFGTCRFGVSFDQSYFGGAPWDDTDGLTYNKNYIIKSPLFELEKVTTPTIIFHGSEDRAVPRDQGFEYYRALQQVGKAPVRFLWFPGQPHGLRKITHQLRKMKEELRWIDEFLFNKSAPSPSAYKNNSPLAMLLKRDSAATYNNLLGINKAGKLIPEVVPMAGDSISIAPFEVTNAQFKAFSTKYSYPLGQENFPALLSFQQASEYVEWLKKISGENYRMPSPEEAKILHKKAMKHPEKENTLNYWSGYEITIDEVPNLQRSITSQNLQLIKEAGQFSPINYKETRLYDVGGNVAEFASDGSTYGFHAYQFVDKANADKEKVSKYTGLRVMKDH